MTDAGTTPKRRFLVQYDYGMGALSWWVFARSAREIRETFAQTEVLTDPDVIERAESSGLDEVDVDAPDMPPGLDDLRAERDAQRGRPGFGALADRRIVHLRYQDGDDPAVYLVEVGADGRRLRQVELVEGGPDLRSSDDDWFFNTPVVDLYDPELPGREIGAEEFEDRWNRARHDDRE